MTGTAATVEGLDTLTRTLDAFARDLGNLDDAAAAAGAKVLARARATAPKRSGRLAGSGFAQVDGSDAAIGFRAAHAAPLEWGVGPRVGLRGPHNIPARHYLAHALTSSQDDVEGVYAVAVNDRLDNVRGA